MSPKRLRYLHARYHRPEAAASGIGILPVSILILGVWLFAWVSAGMPWWPR